jgi:MSHA biogenesis protein MshP
MFHNQSNKRRELRSRKKQRGSMLVMAIFILTVMIFLAVSLQDIYTNASKSIAYEVYGTRALSAANSAAEQALQKVFFLQAQPALTWVVDSPSAGVDTSNLSVDLSGTTAFHGCTVAVVVTRFEVSETGYTHYRVDSTATCIAGDFTTVRTIAIEGRER